MQDIIIRTTRGAVLYHGRFHTIAQALESAVDRGVNLDYADLSGAYLAHANLDGCVIRYGCFRDADLSGVNMSEAMLDHSDFSEARLFDACFCYSSLRGCCFIGTRFGATDISEAVLDQSRFGDPSALLLPFHRSQSHRGCVYLEDRTAYPMEQVPVAVHGIGRGFVLLDDSWQWRGYVRKMPMALRFFRQIPRLFCALLRCIAKFSRNQKLSSYSVN